MLWQSGAFRANQDVDERVMDSMDLEREKGITILAKNTAVRYGDVKLNIVDTPGHADFGGEVERGLTMVDGVLLLVDASEGPLPQTRFVLRKALEARLPVILVVNKVDRPDARIAEVVDEVYELFLDLDADEVADRLPDRLHERQGGLGVARPRATPGTDLAPLWTCSSSTSRRPSYDPAHPLQAHVTNLDASPYVGRLAICRVRHGDIRRGAADRLVPRRRQRSSAAKVTELYVTEALDRVDADEAGPGEIIAVAGLADVTIGETLADPEDPRPLPVITVDEPSLSVTIGINTSPLAGQDGDKLTARQVKRPPRRSELVGNVSIRVLDTERPDAWEVQGRGELQLAVLVELMRREGFELTVGQPQVVTREIDGKVARADRAHDDRRPRGLRRRRHPAAGPAQGPHGADGQPRHGLGADGVPRPRPRADRLPHRVPHRDARHRAAAPRLRRLGAVGRRAAHAADRLAGRRPPRQSTCVRAASACRSAGRCSSRPGEEVYEGMIVGENARADDLDVNAVKEKHLDEHPLVDRRRAGAPGAAAAALARPGARVPARGRVRRGDAEGRPAAQGRARQERSA